LSFHLGSLTPSPVGVRAGANRSSVYLDRDELPGALIEHREVACCDLEVGTVEMEPALAFQRLDTREATQILDGDLNPFPFELYPQLGRAPSCSGRQNSCPCLVQNVHPIGNESRLRLTRR